MITTDHNILKQVTQSSQNNEKIKKDECVWDVVELVRDENTAREWFEKVRWGETGRLCAHCVSNNTVTVKNERPQPYRCLDCKKYFSVRVNTVMHRSHISYRNWIMAIYEVVINHNSKSSRKLGRTLGIKQESAWYLLHRIREGWNNHDQLLRGIVEVDETYVGGLEKNKHANKKLNAGRGGVGKQAVIGALERPDNTPKSRVYARTISGTKRSDLHRFIFETVEKGAIVYTDDHRGYPGMPKARIHKTVNHSQKQYVQGDVHTNGIESFWANLERAYKGTFHKLSPKHMDRYLMEFAGRHNNSWRSLIDHMAYVAGNFMNKRITYAQLVMSTPQRLPII